LVREKEASEDELRRSESRLQNLTDQHIQEMDLIAEQKEAEVMQV